MELFELIKTIFKSEKDWSKLKNIDKTKNFFMVNRIMSIQFPLQANQFNHTKISPRPVVDWWHENLHKHYSKSPSWIFTKTKKNESTEKNKDIFLLDEETEKFLLFKLEISKRELEEIKKFYPQKYEDWVLSIKQQIVGTTK